MRSETNPTVLVQSLRAACDERADVIDRLVAEHVAIRACVDPAAPSPPPKLIENRSLRSNVTIDDRLAFERCRLHDRLEGVEHALAGAHRPLLRMIAEIKGLSCAARPRG